MSVEVTPETSTLDSQAQTQQHLEQAYAHEEEGRLADALRECELAIQVAPEAAEAHNLQGIVLEQLGHKERAMVAYREAVRLDPDFEEAQQNLLEAQGELRESQQRIQQKQTWRTAWYGALGYGISFAVIGAASVILQGRIRGNFTALALVTLLYALGSGAGAATLGKTSQRNTWLLAGAGALGFGVAYLATTVLSRFLFSILISRGASLDAAFTINSTARFALTGAVTGLVMGAAQRNWRQAAWLTLAGTFGFGLYGLSSSFTVDVALLMGWLTPDSISETGYGNAALAMAFAGHGALFGGLSGALLGLAAGQVKLEGQI